MHQVPGPNHNIYIIIMLPISLVLREIIFTTYYKITIIICYAACNNYYRDIQITNGYRYYTRPRVSDSFEYTVYTMPTLYYSDNINMAVQKRTRLLRCNIITFTSYTMV